MASTIKVLASQSNVDNATAVTALNVAIAAEQLARSPQPVNVQGYSSAAGIAAGPLQTYTVSCIIQTFG